MGHIASEPTKREKNGRPACLFKLSVADITDNKRGLYEFNIILRDKAAEYALMNFELGAAVLIEGKLTSINYAPLRDNGNVVVNKVDILAHSITSLDSFRNKRVPATLQHTQGVATAYPAAEENEARTEAENTPNTNNYE